MKKEFGDFVSKRCEEELLRNEEYVKTQALMIQVYKSGDLEAYSDLSMKLQNIVEMVAYRTALRDTFNVLLTN